MKEDKKELILPAVRGRLGDRDYYTSTMKIKDIAERVQYALDFSIERNPSNLIQRDINKKRIKKIADYLQNNDERFFNALVIAVDGKPKWQHFEDLGNKLGEYQEYLGFLTLSGEEKMYAIDGQHRLDGMKEYTKNIKNSAVAESESVSVVFVAHESTTEGKKRSRRLFTVLNKNAVKVAKLDIIYLDEDDTMALVTRKLIEEKSGMFSLTKKTIHKSTDALNTSNENTKYAFTTLGMLYDCLTILFLIFTREKKKDLLENGTKADIDQLSRQTNTFFNTLKKNLTQVNEYFAEKNDSELEKIVKEYRNSDNGGYLLFRPMGLKIFIEVFATIYKTKYKDEKYNEQCIDIVVERIAKLPLNINQEPCCNLIWNAKSGKIIGRGFSVLKQIYLYMLGIGKFNEQELQKKYQNAIGNDNKSLPQKLI